MVVDDGPGDLRFTARDNGWVSVVDADTGRVVARTRVSAGQSVTVCPGGNTLSLDGAPHFPQQAMDPAHSHRLLFAGGR